MNLPEKYLNEMKELLKDDYDDYIASFDSERFYGLRVNTNKISVEDFLKISPFKLKPIPWSNNGFYYDGNLKPAKHPYYYAGLYYLQEPSAMLPASLLPIEENDKVLDGCAAPGGKSLEIANKLKKTGLLVSNDISASRAIGLLKNMEMAGVNNSFVISEDMNKLADYYPEYFDKILIDAPCSGEGMFRKDSALINSWVKNGPEYYSEIQKQIIESAYKMLKKGGMMLFSTCTFAIKENEETIGYLLDKHEDCKLVEVERINGFTSGVSERFKDCVRLYPFKINGEGHFAALIYKEAGTNKVYENTTVKPAKLSEAALQFLKNVKLDTLGKQFTYIGDKLYLINPDIDTKKIRVLRSGLLIGEDKKNRFEPSQALAMALRKEEFGNVIDLKASDNRVIKYLKGETLDISDYPNVKNDWVLVCVDGYPLGFGKNSNGTLKNKYEPGWRYA